MKVHHLNCGSLRGIDPLPGSADVGAAVVCHCLLVETDDHGLVLVETGIGSGDIADPDTVLGAEWSAFAQPALRPEETARRQITRMGFAPEDVRHIVLTHLDRDHAGGLSDFPDATVHVHAAEHEHAVAGKLDRYRAPQFAHAPRWATYTPDRGGESWFGFDAVRELRGLPAEFLLIPLAGHSPGHVGVAVDTGAGWLLHAGDSYFHHDEVHAPAPRSHPLMDVIQLGAEVDRDHRLGNQARLRELIRLHGDEIEVFSAHDPWEFQRLAAHD
ncbi:MBL fold metallo-hydrolase [Nocardia panacis]|uniref:MBL fold metallo-hydrolase n=2 Tax=Nocardia panacis TaxID=2340916 RepID=A0A3A4K1Z3_9NOCA|nr:MBL fold metallo-hydrolase [Nocardia panacis]RJO70177.1 MBL fold metallo-hydrolase [Nocardia panacis]